MGGKFGRTTGPREAQTRRALASNYPGLRIVACSGGADSLCLAHLCAVAAPAQTILAYVDHGLREEAVQEAARVTTLGAKLGVEVCVLPVSLDQRASVERAARDARYAALEELRAQRAARWVLLAHTASDQAETVLLRILRGTGLVGLAAIPETRGVFARPLLHWWRQDTEAYCQRHRLPYVEDQMNRDLRFARSRVRHRWLPALREEHPNIDANLVELAGQARAHREVLDFAAKEILRGRCCDERLRVDAGWGDVPRDLAVRALQLFWEQLDEVGGRKRQLNSKHLEALYRLSCDDGQGSKALDLPGRKIVREYGVLVAGGSQPAADEIIGVPPGCTVRLWQPGDRMRPQRLRGKSRKLSDLFGEARIPVSLRRVARVVERSSDGELLWAEHIGAAFASKHRIRRVPKARESAT